MTKEFMGPEWAKETWDPYECTIEPCADAGGGHAVVDHKSQITICTGTLAECVEFLAEYRQ